MVIYLRISITAAEIKQSLVDPQFAASISQHPVESAFAKLALADKNIGIMALMPKEGLHVFGVGEYAKVVKIIHDLIGKKSKNAKYKDHIDQLHQRVTLDLRRNSERGFPRSSNRFGFMDMSRVTGSERVGNLYIFLVSLHTFQGKGIMKPFLDRAGISISKFAYTITLLLAYDQWTQSRNISRWEVKHAMPVVEELMRCILIYLPKTVV